MENLNAEQIKKALECCYDAHCCEGCHFDNMNRCVDKLGVETFALIKSQEQRIAELTEENERLRVDNEILKMPRATIFEIADAFERGRRKGKSDTVRKMQERLKAHLEKPEFPWDSFTVSEEVIDQIANELLTEGAKNERTTT